MTRYTPPLPVRVRRDGTVLRGTLPIGRVLRAGRQWTAALGEETLPDLYRRQSDAALALNRAYLAAHDLTTYRTEPTP